MLFHIVICCRIECYSNEQQTSRDSFIYLFIHVCTLFHWQDVLSEQLNRIETSGLYSACDSISVGVLGLGDITPFLEKYPKLNVLFQHPNVKLYERPTILSLYSLSKEKPNSLLMYIHTKGITRLRSPHVVDWVDYMEYFVIDLWRDCVKSLQKHDACGVDWSLSPSPHFSGNFWWATSNYVSHLPGYIGSDYLDPEMWIGQHSSPKIECFHYSKVNLYKTPYKRPRYARRSVNNSLSSK